MEKQEKLDILVNDFKKLEESQKDYIRDLTRKLVDVHCWEGYTGMVFQKAVPYVQNIHCRKGVLT